MKSENKCIHCGVEYDKATRSAHEFTESKPSEKWYLREFREKFYDGNNGMVEFLLSVERRTVEECVGSVEKRKMDDSHIQEHECSQSEGYCAHYPKTDITNTVCNDILSTLRGLIK